MSGGTAVIDKGLAAGTRIVVAGQYRLDQGSRVSAANDTDGTHLAGGAASSTAE
jgi:hypothetical protein